MQYEAIPLNWCNVNGILDVRVHPGNRRWELYWPYYEITVSQDKIIRKIEIHIHDKSLDSVVFTAFSGAFTNHLYPPMRMNFSDYHCFQESELEIGLSQLKQYADSLTEKDLILYEDFIRK